MAASLSVRPNRLCGGSSFQRPPVRCSDSFRICRTTFWGGVSSQTPLRTLVKPARPLRAGSRADDSLPFEMSFENALKLLGVSEGASFEDILRAKNSILATCVGDKEAIAQVEAAYDMLLMKSLSQRRAGKVVDSGIRYADVKSTSSSGIESTPQWLQSAIRNMPVSFETPSTGDLGIQAGIYGALMVLTFVNGATASSSVPYAGADVPGLILAGSFGASLYFITKRKVKLARSYSVQNIIPFQRL